MRVNKEFSHDGYRSHHRKKYDDRLKARTHRHNAHHHSRSNGKSSSRISSKSHYYHYEKHASRSPSSSSNRKDHQQLNYYDNQTSSLRFDPPKHNEDSYLSLIANKNILYDDLNSDSLRHKASQSTSNRSLTSHLTDSEQNYHSSSSSYRTRDNTHPSSSYENEYISRNHTGNDLYIRNEYRSSPSIIVAPSPIRNTIDSYKDSYYQSDYNSRSQQFDIESNRSSSSSTYHSMTPIKSSTYRSDSYRTLSNIRMSSPTSHPSLSSSCSSSTSSYAATHDQYTQTFSPIRENDYRIQDYKIKTSTDHRQIITNKSSDHQGTDYYSSSSYRDQSNSKRTRSSLDENYFKRPMRR